jgi:hypothetical protein
MPYQVNGQAVATKSQTLLHGAGGGGEAGIAAGGGVFVTMILSAHASPVDAPPAIPRIITVQTPKKTFMSFPNIRK